MADSLTTYMFAGHEAGSFYWKDGELRHWSIERGHERVIGVLVEEGGAYQISISLMPETVRSHEF
jgi:hypothetical protein